MCTRVVGVNDAVKEKTRCGVRGPRRKRHGATHVTVG